jgi:hypothetical protein
MTKQRNKKKKLVAKGTGLHIDSNLYNMWKTERITGENVDLERLRAFQSFVALSDANKDKEIRDGGLEVVPGFHLLAGAHYDAITLTLQKITSLIYLIGLVEETYKVGDPTLLDSTHLTING